MMITLGTDAKALGLLGIPTYGFVPLRLEPDVPYLSLFHANDERIPVSALRFGLPVLQEVVRTFCRSRTVSTHPRRWAVASLAILLLAGCQMQGGTPASDMPSAIPQRAAQSASAPPRREALGCQSHSTSRRSAARCLGNRRTPPVGRQRWMSSWPRLRPRWQSCACLT